MLLGGLLGEYVLRNAAWRWLVLFVSLAGGMWFVARDAYAASPHIEWPGAVQTNPWLSAFYWIRENTPKNAVFALGPDFMSAHGEDAHGFRAIAERSMLADHVKDSGGRVSLSLSSPTSGRRNRAHKRVGRISVRTNSAAWPGAIL